MRKVAAIMAIAVVCIAAVAVASPETKSVVGTITRIDNASKSMVVKDSSGIETTVYWNDGSKVDGGELREGSMVKIETRDQDGKTVATSIQVQVPKKPY